MVRVALVALVVAACQGGSSDAPSAKGSATGSAVVARPKPPAPADAAIDAPDDPDKVIDDLRAVSAWQAVVDRTLYLARRGQHGVVYGTLGAPIPLPAAPGAGAGSSGSASGAGNGSGSNGHSNTGSNAMAGSGSSAVAPATAAPPASPYTWFVDDTEGNGALAIRVELGKYALKTKTGDRVALGGAWALDDAKHYYWKVDAMQPLPPAKPSESKDPPLPPGHVITTGDFPAGVKRISLAKEGDAAYFTVVGAPPTVDGDGWPVADELGNPIVGLLVLPGERASYGAQDMRTPDERWQLKRGQTYWVRISRFHKRGTDKPPAIIARTPPVWVR